MKKILKKLYHYIFRFKSCDKSNTIVDYAFINKNKTIYPIPFNYSFRYPISPVMHDEAQTHDDIMDRKIGYFYYLALVLVAW